MITKYKIFEKNISIDSPIKGSIVKHTGWRFEDDENYPGDVWIVSGSYLDSIYGRLSNFWSWRRVLPNGDLAVEESGYGSFNYSEVVDYKKYTQEQIKEIYPKKYEEYRLKKDAERYNL